MHGSRVVLVVVHVGAVKNICSGSGGAHIRGKRGSKQDETQFSTKNAAFLSPHTMLLHFFAGFS
jgi:hypothetical protein